MNVDVENRFSSLSDLPNEVLLHILGYFDYDDLKRVSLVNRRYHDIARNDILWRPLCKKHWMLDSSESWSCWQDAFKESYKEYGRYIKIYPRVAGAFKKLKGFLRTNSPTILKCLLDGVSEADIDMMEEHQHCFLPEDLRLFYRLCGGHGSFSDEFCPPGLFGSTNSLHPLLKFDSWYCEFTTSNVDVIKTKEGEYCLFDFAVGESSFAVVVSRKRGQDYTDSENLPPLGSVVWTALEDGRAVFENAPSFVAWFEDFVEKTVSGYYPMQDGHIMRYNFEPDCVARTGSMVVRVGWTNTMFWDTAHMLFEYRITLSMDEDANPRDSCKLLSRHWIITHDDDGRQENVNGPGVVGEYPVMKPGGKYSWMSRTNFSSPGGSMEGHFTFRNLQTSDTIEIKCPKYHMKFPYRYR